MDNHDRQHSADQDAIRDPSASLDAVLEARSRPMSERLELALSWNAVVAELQVAVALDSTRAKGK